MKTNKVLKFYKEILGKIKPVILDVGARNGVKNKFLNELAGNSLIKLILIELDKNEAKKLKSPNIIVIDKALWNKKGSRKVFFTKNKSYTSLLRPNEKVVKGSFYYDRSFYDIIKTSKINTTTINEIISEKKNKIKNIDFLKIDIQGAEGKIFQNFNKNNWNDLLGCETEAYSSQVYKNCNTIEFYFNKFYKNNFELFKIKNISSLIRTSYNNEKIYNDNYLGARPNTRFYRGKELTYDLIFFKNLQYLIKNPNIKKLRIYLFLLILYGYFDQAFYLLLIMRNKKIISKKIFLNLKNATQEILSFSTHPLRKIKERFLLKNYTLKNI
ncbi:FkbM family methyltransferase [Pelagibacterales bacterium SAG-MED21]|nr:FkbM family methyltransferase [Pelagibacterales bacterium SAG-MED21]